MDLNELRRWVGNLTTVERELPAATIGGEWFSPIEMLQKVESGQGQDILNFLSTTHLGTERALLEERLVKRLEKYPQDKPLLITLNKAWSPNEIINEIKNNTQVGESFLEKERQMLKYTDRLKERI